MDEEKKTKNNERKKWEKTIDTQASRKLKAKRQKPHNAWHGCSLFGLIGWSVAIPTLLGAALGVWLDEEYPQMRSWTLTFLLAGLTLGCVNAWYWLGVERKKINELKDDE